MITIFPKTTPSQFNITRKACEWVLGMKETEGRKDLILAQSNFDTIDIVTNKGELISEGHTTLQTAKNALKRLK